MKKVYLLIIAILILSLSSCDILQDLLEINNSGNNNNNNTGQTTTSITSPSNGANFNKGDAITVQAKASNPDGITKVTLFVDNNNHSSDQNKPYSFTVNGLSVGSHSFFVRALDANNNTKDSGKINITIKESVITVSKKFTVTSVKDDLDNSDGQNFIDEFGKLDFTLDQWDKDVSKSELKSYLGLKQEFLYHTGHGSVGKIMTSDGSLNTSGLIVNTRATIVATCLTMKDTSWKNVFGSTAEIIMGYTKVSWDKPTDNNLVKSFLSKVSSGTSYLKSWYISNAGISALEDRWLAYVKEGSGIVEYSARSNNTPRYIPNGIPVVLYDQITVDSSLLDDPSAKFDRGFNGANVEEATLSLNRNDISKDAWPTTRISISIDDAINMAEDELTNRGGKPANTIFHKVVPIQKCDEFNMCYTVAYQVYYVQQYNGQILSSNIGTDHIALLISDNGVYSLDSSWSRIVPNDEIISSEEMLNVGAALSIAGESISRLVRNNAVNVVGFDNVQGVLTKEDGSKILVPAYEFFSENGERFIVSAVTGELVF